MPALVKYMTVSVESFCTLWELHELIAAQVKKSPLKITLKRK